jgi:predicted nuclease of predicted toxin-antitoxin system
VKFLVDANLPPRLCVWLRSHRHEAEHLFDRNLLTATDTQIWERGRVESLIILSKDVDFYDRALLFGAPPQVVMSPLATAATLGFSKCWLRRGSEQ